MVLRFAHLSPHEALNRVNRLIVDSTPQGISVSLLWIKLMPDGDVLYANAGHPYPLIARRHGGMDVLDNHGILAGWFCDSSYSLYRNRLEAGDTLLVYTDGLSDLELDEDTRLGEEKIQACLTEKPGDSLDVLSSRLLAPLQAGRQGDDVTLLLIRRLEEPTTTIKPDARGRYRTGVC
jgi:sigma-B regulation protein RsbU (phosphoserine phosphatase)